MPASRCALLALLCVLCMGAAPATDPPLIAAVKHNDYAKTRAILQKRVDPDVVSLALFNAAAFNAKPAIDALLLQHGADVRARLRDHSTALHYAAMNATPAVIEMLLKRGADVDATDQDMTTPLEWAAQNKKLPNVKFLLQHGADGPGALVNQAYWKHLDALRTLLDGGVDVNARSNRRGSEGDTALFRAAFGNDMNLVRFLLQRGADVNAVEPGDSNMTTALMMAAYFCNSDMITLLAQYGARDTIRAHGDNAYDLARTGWTHDMEPCDSSVLSQLSDLQ